MKIAIDLIKVNEERRIRKEIGNLQPLEASIGKVGLINPILIDEQSNLVAGYRRLEACRKLGLKEVEVRIVEFGGDSIKLLDIEVAENFFRKDFTPEEILASERRRRAIIEESRKKGLWERFLRWLQGIFSSKPVAEQESSVASSKVETMRAAETSQPSLQDEKPAHKEAGDQAEKAEPDDRPAPAEATDANEEQPAGADVTEHADSDTIPDKAEDERPITWRTS